MIGRGAQLRVGTSLLDMLVLGSNWTYVPFPAIAFFFSRRTHIDTAVPAVVADPVFRDVFDSCVTGVVNDRFVYVIYVCVVVKTIVIPAAAFVAVTPIAKSIVDAAIKSNVRAPIAFVPEEGAASPTPICSKIPAHKNIATPEVLTKFALQRTYRFGPQRVQFDPN